MYVCMHVCMYACMHVCMYACMHVILGTEMTEKLCSLRFFQFRKHVPFPIAGNVEPTSPMQAPFLRVHSLADCLHP